MFAIPFVVEGVGVGCTTVVVVVVVVAVVVVVVTGYKVEFILRPQRYIVHYYIKTNLTQFVRRKINSTIIVLAIYNSTCQLVSKFSILSTTIKM